MAEKKPSRLEWLTGAMLSLSEADGAKLRAELAVAGFPPAADLSLVEWLAAVHGEGRLGRAACNVLKMVTEDGGLVVAAPPTTKERWALAVASAAFASLRGQMGCAYQSLASLDVQLAFGGQMNERFEERLDWVPLVILDDAHGRLHDRTDRWLAALLAERKGEGKKTVILSMDRVTQVPSMTAMVVKSAMAPFLVV